jgi:8-oxo-dGTP diphosphatase
MIGSRPGNTVSQVSAADEEHGIAVSVKQIAQVLLFDRACRLLIYLRDDKPDIPFPNSWDLFGGHVEEGETPEQALRREIKEELGIELKEWTFFRRFDCVAGDVYPNSKYIYWAMTHHDPGELTLYEGQRLAAITMAERETVKFANILDVIIDEFIGAGLWPRCG